MRMRVSNTFRPFLEKRIHCLTPYIYPPNCPALFITVFYASSPIRRRLLICFFALCLPKKEF